jgi:hypothetical protein
MDVQLEALDRSVGTEHREGCLAKEVCIVPRAARTQSYPNDLALPVPTGSIAAGWTIGIVVVAFLTARAARFSSQNRVCLAQSIGRKAQGMAETTINVLNALQGQQAQLKRLIAQKIWISDAPKATLVEMDAQVTQIKALLAEIERDIQDQMKRAR